MTKLRIELSNNSDARRWTSLFPSIPARHNGGKTMIALVHDVDLDAAYALLDESHAVRSYTSEAA